MIDVFKKGEESEVVAMYICNMDDYHDRSKWREIDVECAEAIFSDKSGCSYNKESLKQDNK